MREFNINIFIFFIYIFFLIIIYSKYIIYGGLSIGDESVLILRSLSNNEIYSYSKHFERPVSNFFYNFFHYLYKDNLILYNFTSVLLWITLSLNLYFIFKKFNNIKTSYIFLLLISFPFLSSTLITGVHLFCSYTFSLIFWSLSVLFFINYATNNNIIYFFLGLILLILSILTLSYILPLLIFNVFLPAIISFEKNKINFIKEKFKTIIFYTFPIFIICFLFLMYKLYFGTFFNRDHIYGLSEINLHSILQSVYYFFVILTEIPLMFIETIIYLDFFHIFIFLFLFIFFYLIYKNNKKIDTNKINFITHKYFFHVSLVALFTCPVIFLLSGYPSTSIGYYNRLMAPSFICYTIILSFLLSFLLKKRLFILPILISFLWISSLSNQIQNSIEAWNMKKIVLNDIKNSIEKIYLKKSNIVLIANVPYFLENNYNNEGIFMTKWDFNASLKIFELENINAMPVSYRILKDRSYYPGHNILNIKFIDKIDLSNQIVLYYEFNKGHSNIIRINSKNDLDKIFQNAINKKINYNKIIIREKLRLYFKEKITKLI